MMDSNAQPEHGEAGSTALSAPKVDGYRTERTVWIVALLLPLLAYCVVAVLTYSIKPTPINTGDALYDKYLAWVADNIKEAGESVNYAPNGQSWTSAGGSVNFDPFAGWEAEFGDDPRYWMLRYRYSRSANDYSYQGQESGLNDLGKARELGVANGPALLILLKRCGNDVWNNSTYNSKSKNSTYGSKSVYSSTDYRREMEKYLRGQVDEQVGEEHDQLLAELLEVAGDESLPHYYAALFDSQRGDYAAAITHLADGNRAPGNSCMTGFPFEDYVTGLQQSSHLPDKRVSGAIGYAYQRVALPNYIHFKQMVRMLLADAISRNDRAALDEIHTFACRFGSQEGGTLISTLVSLVMVDLIEAGFSKDYGSSLEPEFTINLSKLVSLRGQIRSQITMTGPANRWVNPQTLPPAQRAKWYFEGVLSGGLTSSSDYLEMWQDYFAKEQARFVVRKTLLEQLESFNYNTLEWE